MGLIQYFFSFLDEYEGQGESAETTNNKTMANRQKVWKQPIQKRPRRYHPMRGRPWENSMETCRFFERGNCRNVTYFLYISGQLFSETF